MHSNLHMSPWRTQRALPSRLPCDDGRVQYLFVVYLAARLHPARPGLGEPAWWRPGSIRTPQHAKMPKTAGNQFFRNPSA
jgi:hypothetical protein